jgi:hypothetical protein
LTGRIDPYELDPAWPYAYAYALNYALFIQRPAGSRTRSIMGAPAPQRLLSKAETPGAEVSTRGPDLANYSRFARIAACRADARAKIAITALMVILSRLGSVMVGCGGHTIQIVAGASSGSRSSISSPSALILPRASWVVCIWDSLPCQVGSAGSSGVTASDGPLNWHIRCQVEKLLTDLECLPPPVADDLGNVTQVCSHGERSRGFGEVRGATQTRIDRGREFKYRQPESQ